MQSVLLTSSSNFGKYLSNKQSSPTKNNNTTSLITLKQNYIHQHPFISCKLDLSGNKLCLVDTSNQLIYLNLLDNSYSSLKSTKKQCKVTHFSIDGHNNLSLLYVSENKGLFRVCFDNKKPQKIINLNMGKIVAFQRNYLREIVLVLDYKILFLYDVTKKIGSTLNKIRSLKAGYNQVFTNACFASNNRFIVLAVKNIEIRVVEIMNMQTVHQIRLPFAIENLKIQVSYTGKNIAIYGDSNFIFFITLATNKEEQLSYELIQIPFLASITHLKYTANNTLLFLGNDQVLYGIRQDKMDRAIPIFNEHYQLRMMTFDISVNSDKIILISHRNVYQLTYKNGVDQAIRAVEEDQGRWKQLQYRVNGLQAENQEETKQIKQVLQQQLNSNEFQYDDQDQSEQDSDREPKQSQIKLNSAILKNNHKLPKFTESPMPLNPIIMQQKTLQLAQKKQLNHIFTHLCSRYRDICIGQNDNIVRLIMKLHSKLQGNYINCLGILDLIFSSLSQQFEKLSHYVLVLCPDIVSIIQKKFDANFQIFYMDLCLTICLDYFIDQQWANILNWLIQNHQTTYSLPIFVIAMLRTMLPIVSVSDQWSQLVKPSAENLFKDGLTFSEVHNEIQKIYNNEKFRNLFVSNSKSESQMIKISSKISRANEADPHLVSALKEEEEIMKNLKLEELILKQQQIKKQLNRIKRNKPI